MVVRTGIARWKHDDRVLTWLSAYARDSLCVYFQEEGNIVDYNNFDRRTRLLLSARGVNGVALVVNDEDDWKVMQQMVREGLFTYSALAFSRGYWWTPAGQRAAEEAWQRAPVQRINTRYRDHPQVRFSLNGYKEELCHVVGPNSRNGLRVREVLGTWLVDHPNGQRNVPFGSVNQAITWALRQVGKPRT